MEDLKAKVCKSQWGEDRIPSFYSCDLKDIIRGLLKTDPKDRPKPAQLLRLPRLMGRICLFVGGFSIPRTLGDFENPAHGAILEHLQALSGGQLPPSIAINALVSPAEAIKSELKHELKYLHEATKAPDSASLCQMWNEIHELERRVEIHECSMQLLNLLIKWVSESTPIELPLPPEPAAPMMDPHVPMMSRPPPNRCNGHGPGLAETISLEGEMLVSDVVCDDRPSSGLPSPRRWINASNVHVNASSELQDVPALQPWRVAAPRARTEARYSDSEAEADMSELQTDRSGQPRIRNKFANRILHNVELRPVDVPCSPGALGQLLKDFECESGRTSHMGQRLLPADAIPASPLKALLKHHFNGTNCHTQSV